MSSVDSQQRVLSGMRPTGKLHLGHYHGVLKNWVKLQHEFECFFFVADWHALTTEYDNPAGIEQSVWDMVIDWLAAGVNPGSSTMFIQSQVPEHAELHLLLSMITPLGWLERVPTFKDQQEKLREKDLATYGFLGYPLLQSADILVYRAGKVPVGADQVSHVEITREIARRFNHIYGREQDLRSRPRAPSSRWVKRTPSCIATSSGVTRKRAIWRHWKPPVRCSRNNRISPWVIVSVCMATSKVVARSFCQSRSRC